MIARTVNNSFAFLIHLMMGLYLTSYSLPTFADVLISSTEKGQKIVKRLSEDPKLRLSLDSPEERFSFVISIGKSSTEKTIYQAHYFVIRDRQSIAIVMLSKDGNPYGYSRIGLCALLGSESDRPLLLTEGGVPKVVLQLKDNGKKLLFELVFSSRLKTPEIVIDIPSILAEAAKKPSRVQYDEVEKTVTLETEHHALITMRLSGSDNETSSLKEVAIQSSSGISTVISNISFFNKDSKITTVTRKAFEGLNVPKRQVPKGAMLLVPPFPPEKFGELLNDAPLIEELRKILPGLPLKEALPKNVKINGHSPSKIPERYQPQLRAV